MIKKTQNRDEIFLKLKAEIIGPAPKGNALDFSKPVIFKNVKDIYQPFVQLGTGEEVIQRDSPLTRYGAGILYPLPAAVKKTTSPETNPLQKIVFADRPENIFPEQNLSLKSSEEDASMLAEEDEFAGAGRLDLSAAHKHLPNSMGVTCLAEIKPGAQLIVNVTGGRYRMETIVVGKEKRQWWLRQQVELSAKYNDLDQVYAERKVSCGKLKSINTKGLKIEIEV